MDDPTRLPHPAVRARSVVARATTAEVWWLDRRTDHSVTAPARHLVVEPGAPAPGTRPLLVEVADAAPLPVRSRIRGRVRISGQGETDDDGVLHVHPAALVLHTGPEPEPIRPADFLAAEVDPLGQLEGALLCHLDAAHPEVTEQLTRLLSPRHLHGVVRVRPLALDQHGLVLRLEYARRDSDVRLAFPTPARCAVEVRHRLATLLSEAGDPRRRRRRSPAALVRPRRRT